MPAYRFVQNYRERPWATFCGPHHVELRKVYHWSPSGITAKESQASAEGQPWARAKVEQYRQV